MTSDPAFARLAGLFDVGLLGEAKVIIAGCGSGGSQVALQLVMSGIRDFALFDEDALEIENVIRHACGRRYLDQRKVDAVEDLLRDRNPEIAVAKYDVDLMAAPNLADVIKTSSVVVLATDNDATRYKINQLCVDLRKPFVTGRVFTRGIGGEVFAYHPGETGCLACLESVLERTTLREGVREIDLVGEEEREKLYGMEVAEIKDSPGLNIDIAFITCFHTRLVLDTIARGLPERPKFLPPLEQNYFVWGNRPIPPFSRHFELQKIALNPQEGCLVCGLASPA